MFNISQGRPNYCVTVGTWYLQQIVLSKGFRVLKSPCPISVNLLPMQLPSEHVIEFDFHSNLQQKVAQLTRIVTIPSLWHGILAVLLNSLESLTHALAASIAARWPSPGAGVHCSVSSAERRAEAHDHVCSFRSFWSGRILESLPT